MRHWLEENAQILSRNSKHYNTKDQIEAATNAKYYSELKNIVSNTIINKSGIDGYKYDFGIDVVNIHLVKNDLPSGVQKLGKFLGKKLLPTRNESLNEARLTGEAGLLDKVYKWCENHGFEKVSDTEYRLDKEDGTYMTVTIEKDDPSKQKGISSSRLEITLK